MSCLVFFINLVLSTSRRELIISPSDDMTLNWETPPNLTLNTVLGDYRWFITGTAEDQETFDKGLMSLYNFNHIEAAKWYQN